MTLNKQLFSTLFIFTLSLTFVFCLIAVIGLFIVENNTFFRELQLKEENLMTKQRLPTLMNSADSTEITDSMVFYQSLTKSPFKQLKISNGKSHKLNVDNQHYRIRLLNRTDCCQPILVYNVTNRMLVSRNFYEIIMAFSMVFFSILFVLYFITQRLSKRLLEPFNTLVQSLQKNQDYHNFQQRSEQIEQQDVRAIYTSIYKTWQHRESLLEEQLTFNRGISHELRTPIQVIKQSIELLKVETEEQDKVTSHAVNSPIQKKLLDRLLKASFRMENICNAFLWLSTDKEWHDSSDSQIAFDSVLTLFKEELLSRKITVKTTHSDNSGMNLPLEVHQVILNNLLVNSIQYTYAHENKNAQITVFLRENEIIFRNERSATNHASGFGLGLEIVRQLLQRFGYKLTVDTTKNQYCVIIQ